MNRRNLPPGMPAGIHRKARQARQYLVEAIIGTTGFNLQNDIAVTQNIPNVGYAAISSGTTQARKSFPDAASTVTIIDRQISIGVRSAAVVAQGGIIDFINVPLEPIASNRLELLRDRPTAYRDETFVRLIAATIFSREESLKAAQDIADRPEIYGFDPDSFQG